MIPEKVENPIVCMKSPDRKTWLKVKKKSHAGSFPYVEWILLRPSCDGSGGPDQRHTALTWPVCVPVPRSFLSEGSLVPIHRVQGEGLRVSLQLGWWVPVTSSQRGPESEGQVPGGTRPHVTLLG